MLKHLKTAAVIFLAALIFCGAAQAAVTESSVQTFHLGDTYTIIYSAASASDGGYFLGALHDGKLSILKTDKKGDTQWSTDVSGNYAHRIVSLKDGGCVAVTSDANSSYLYRFDKSGKILWETPLQEISVGISPIAVNENTIKLAGWFTETERGFTQTFALSNGAPANDQISLSDGFVPLSIIKDGDSYILVGETDTDKGSYTSSAWILKMKDGGVVEWKSTIRTECESPEIYGPGSAAYVVCKTNNGKYFVAGTGTPYNKDPMEISGVIWGAFVTADGVIESHKDLKGAIPYGAAQIGDSIIIAGVGWSAPLWFTINENWVFKDVKYPTDFNGAFYGFTEVSKNTVAMSGWSTKTGTYDGYLAEISDPDVKTASSPAPVIGIVLGCTAVLLFGRIRK